MISLSAAIDLGLPIVADGGMGTELQRAGLEPGGCGEEWNLVHPDRVQSIQRRYVEAGAQILLTNTFGTNPFVLSRYGLDEKAAAIATSAVRNARAAAGGRAWVLGDIGPCGGFLEPLGEIAPGALEAAWRSVMGAMLDEGVDGIILETMTAIEELVLGLRVARELDAPIVMASMAYDRVGGGFKTMMGVDPAHAAAACVEAGADLVGANCGRLEPEDFIDVALRLREGASVPLIVQPNAGQPRLEGETIVYPRNPASLAPALRDLARHAAIVGGCCGTTPDHVRAFADALRASA